MTSATAPTWAAVVVNYEAGDCLIDCVTTLLADASAAPVEIVVVDNASTDDSVAKLRLVRPEIRIIETGENLGYSAAANAGIAATSAAVVAVFNADLQINPGTGAALLARFNNEPDLGAAGPAVFSTAGTHFPSARNVPRLRDTVGHGTLGAVMPKNRFSRRYKELDADPKRSRDVDWVSGAAIWLRRSALNQVGGWDDGYFMYVEDVDLCWRLGKAGWRVAYEPEGSVVHIGAVSTNRHPYRMIIAHHRSLGRFASKRWHGWKRILLLPAAIYLALRALVIMGARALRFRPKPKPISR